MQNINLQNASFNAPKNTITIIRPDDWHIHLRDDKGGKKALATTVLHAARRFNRVLCMPNLVPAVKTVNDARAYHKRIMQALDEADLPKIRKQNFDARMTLYLTDSTTEDDIKAAKDSGLVIAVKLYPSGATTNSADGVTDIARRYNIFECMQKYQLPLLVHGEVTHSDIDIFDREKRFLDDVLAPIVQNFSDLKIVMEHITTKDAADFCLAQNANVCATITPQHLLFNRNHMLVGGIRPHFYCLPILKRSIHQHALINAATSGNPKFFIGTDSAPHTTCAKENACGCAGCYSAEHAILMYAQAFDAANQLDKLQGFCSQFGAQFYNLPLNNDTITLVKTPTKVDESFEYMDGTLTPLMAGQYLDWSYAN